VNEDKATRYHRLKRSASVASMLWSVLLLGGLAATGGSAGLRDTAERLAATVPASWHAAATVLFFVLLLLLLNEIASLPLGYYSGYYKRKLS